MAAGGEGAGAREQGEPVPTTPIRVAQAGGTPEEILARAAGENFPVAARVLPRRLRDDLMALYGFARLVDWAGDEAPGDRLALLDALERDLARIFAGQRPEHPLLVRLATTVQRRGLAEEPLRRLIEANRRDQRVLRYATFAELRDYCALSADPVGQLVLQVFGVASPARESLSDRVCTALQLAEHWQDVAEDLRAGRIYLPLEDRERFGCDERALAAAHAGPELRALLAFEVARARRLLESGAPLVNSLRGFARIAVAGFVAGGHAALDAIARCDYDVLPGPPRPRRRDLLRHLLRLLWTSRGRGRVAPGRSAS